MFTDSVRKSQSFKILESNENGNEATVKVEVTRNDYSQTASDMLRQAFSGATAEDLKNKAKENVSKKTMTAEYKLVKEGDSWFLFFDWEKENKIKKLSEQANKQKQEGDFTGSLDKYRELYSLAPSEDVKKVISDLTEKIAYFPKVKVYDTIAKYYNSGWSGIKPYIDFKVKNNGDKELSEVEITVYFKDKNGNVIHEEKYTPINNGGFFSDSGTLKSGRIWQQDEYSYYSSDSLPSEWQEESADFVVTNIEFN